MAQPVKQPARPRLTRRDRQILDAAVEVFARRGYVQASVQDVADAVGLLKGSLYHYIRSKDDLLYRVLDEIHDGVDAVLEEVRALPGLPPLERLGAYVERQVAHNAVHLQPISVYYHDLEQLSERHLSAIEARRRVHERFVVELIAEAQAGGEADPALDPKIAANCVFATLIWTYRWFRPGRQDPAEAGRACARFAIDAVRGPR
jgi:AcrR family transcriptional regulator